MAQFSQRSRDRLYTCHPDLIRLFETVVVHYDCTIPSQMTSLELLDHLESMRPFGHCFEEPVFRLEAPIDDVVFYKDKTTKEPKHTAVTVQLGGRVKQKIMFFNEVHEDLVAAKKAEFLVTASRNTWQGMTQLSLMAKDFALPVQP